MKPPQFTEQQWLDILDWYESGYENGVQAGYLAGFRDAYDQALRATVAALPPTYEPKTAHRPRSGGCGVAHNECSLCKGQPGPSFCRQDDPVYRNALCRGCGGELASVIHTPGAPGYHPYA